MAVSPEQRLLWTRNLTGVLSSLGGPGWQDKAISVRELQEMLNGVLSRRESASSCRRCLRAAPPPGSPLLKCVPPRSRKTDQVRRSDPQHLPQHHQPDGRILASRCVRVCVHVAAAVDSVFAMLVWCFSVVLDDEPGGQHRDAGVSGVQGLLGEDEEVDRTFPFLVVTNLKHATIITKTSGK